MLSTISFQLYNETCPFARCVHLMFLSVLPFQYAQVHTGTEHNSFAGIYCNHCHSSIHTICTVATIIHIQLCPRDSTVATTQAKMHNRIVFVYMYMDIKSGEISQKHTNFELWRTRVSKWTKRKQEQGMARLLPAACSKACHEQAAGEQGNGSCLGDAQYYTCNLLFFNFTYKEPLRMKM